MKGGLLPFPAVHCRTQTRPKSDKFFVWVFLQATDVQNIGSPAPSMTWIGQVTVPAYHHGVEYNAPFAYSQRKMVLNDLRL